MLDNGPKQERTHRQRNRLPKVSVAEELDLYNQRDLDLCGYFHASELLRQVGPRGSATPAEAAAAKFCCKALEDYGLAPQVHSFKAPSSTYRQYAIAFSLTTLLIMFALPRSGNVIVAVVAAALAACCAKAMWNELDFTVTWLSRLAKIGESRNVVAHIPAREEPLERVVLLAHLDSHRTPLFFASNALQRRFSLFVRVCMGSLFFTVPLLLALGVTDHWSVLLSAALTILVQLALVVLCLQADMTPYSPGAIDNASGIGVVLSLASQYSKKPLRYTELVIVLDGSEETGCHGAKAFARDFGKPSDLYVTIDQVGSGDPGFRVRDGLLLKRPADPFLLAICSNVMRIYPELGIRSNVGRGYTNTAALAKMGLKAITIDAKSKDPSAEIHWHRLTDTQDKLERDTIDRANQFAVRLLEEIDNNPGV